MRTIRKRQRVQLLDKGIGLIALGGGMLVAPHLMGSSPMLRPVSQALKAPGWLAVGIGILVLLIHWVLNRLQNPASAPHDAPASREPTWQGRKTLPPTAAQSDAPIVRASEERATPLNRERNEQVSWSQAVFEDIEWRRFEAVCERLFAQAGFETRSQSHGADGGVDIWLYSKNAEGPAAIVQCKHWQTKPVGVKEVREFLGVMTANSVKRGTYATSSTFTAAAVQFAKENGVHLLNVTGLLGLIGRRDPDQQRELLSVAYEGEYWRPTCVACGVKMVERTSKSGASTFWGCANFPRCRQTMAARSA